MCFLLMRRSSGSTCVSRVAATVCLFEGRTLSIRDARCQNSAGAVTLTRILTTTTSTVSPSRVPLTGNSPPASATRCGRGRSCAQQRDELGVPLELLTLCAGAGCAGPVRPGAAPRGGFHRPYLATYGPSAV